MVKKPAPGDDPSPVTRRQFLHRLGEAVSNPSPLLQNPDGPFLFACDHLTYLRGWQEGAVISALNALANLMDLVES